MKNIQTKIFAKLLIGIFLFASFFAFKVDAAGNTYYVSPAGSGSTCSSGAPCLLATGISKLSIGDTLILKDGIYATSITGLPNGTSSTYTNIKAENDGRAIITTDFTLNHTSAYLQFEGLKFNYAGNKNIMGNHLKFLRCAFQGGQATNNEGNVVVGTNDYNDTAYILFEDCWAYGLGGRYKITIYNSDKIILRRVVVRDDGGWTSGSGDPEAGITVYQSSNVSLQDTIVIDSNLSTYDNNNVGAYYLTGHAGNRSSSNVEYLGAMAINNKQWGWQVDTDDGAVGLNMQDIVIYDQEIGAMAQSNTSVSMNIQYATIGKTGYGIANWGTKTNSLSNSFFFALTGATSTGSNTLSNYSTFPSVSAAKTAGLWYFPRIESASALNTNNQGARIKYKIGTSGTLWGDSGYNTITTDSLWPWPNEDRIKTDFANVSGGARGFATGISKDGSPQTLTKYIWEYLGNQIPEDIGGGTFPDTPPTIFNGSPTGTLTYGTTSTNLTVSTDENATCKYSTNPNTAYVSMTNFQTSGSTNHSTPITGLTNGSTYSYYIKCQDTSNNTNTSDYPITFSISNTNTAILGYNPTNGAVNTDSKDQNVIDATKFTTPNFTGTASVSSMSVYVKNIDTHSANKKYQVAIYSDSGGSPSHPVNLIASSSEATLTSTGWNMVSISATLNPNTTYWLAYNTNASADNYNNITYDDTSTGSGTWIYISNSTYGTWPSTISTVTENIDLKMAIYATYSIGSSQTYSISNFTALISSWLTKGTGILSDLNHDNVVNARDLGVMMSGWN